MPKKARSRPIKEPNELVLWIEGQVGKRHGVWYKDIAKEIGIKPAAFTKRMESGRFDYSELVKIFRFFDTPDDQIIRLMKKKGG